MKLLTYRGSNIRYILVNFSKAQQMYLHWILETRSIEHTILHFKVSEIFSASKQKIVYTHPSA
ncbi:hypothetical protein L3i20_v221690 [Paenibacillus sp. L3-i20]|nr:hypothetical protein L3i20_v221690 [Paenibacillus sp. L3-i20]